MKIFYKKDFQRVLEELNELKEKSTNELKIQNDKLWEMLVKLADEKNKTAELTKRLSKTEKVLEEEKANNVNLSEENETLKKEIEDLKSERYLIVKVPKGRQSKKQAVGSKGRKVTNQTRKLLEETSELRCDDEQ